MKRKKLRKKSIEKDNEYYREKCVELAKKIVRIVANYKCEYCGEGENSYPPRKTHGSHIYSEGKNHGMSADLDNILCLCATHHMNGKFVRADRDFNWHANPAESMDWFRGKYPERAEKLRLRSQLTLKVDFKKRYEELKEVFKELNN